MKWILLCVALFLVFWIKSYSSPEMKQIRHYEALLALAKNYPDEYKLYGCLGDNGEYRELTFNKKDGCVEIDLKEPSQ